MKAVLFVALLAILGTAHAFETPIPFTFCNSTVDDMSVSSVSGNPFPFKKGVPLNIFVNGTIGNTVTAGKFNLDVKFSGVHVFGQTGDLCTWSPTFKCPATGLVSIGIVQTIPTVAPSGKYTITLSATDQNNAQVVCIVVNTNIN